MSLLPLSTAWMAVSHLAPQPVSFYAAVFFLVNGTYLALAWELIDSGTTAGVRTLVRWRSSVTLFLFGAAALLALRYPRIGLGICILCLLFYLKPDMAQRRAA
jgi:uncharacterized membrane protein